MVQQDKYELWVVDVVWSVGKWLRQLVTIFK